MTTLPDQRASIAQAFLASIIESSDDAIVRMDQNGIVASWNKGAEGIFGYAAEEIIGKSITLVIPPELRAEEVQILARIRRGERVEHFETVRQRKDGTIINISLTVSPIKNAEGGIVGASKIARDITERRATEARLQRQTERLEALNRVANMIVGDLNIESIVQRVTDVATELTGAQFGAFFYNVRHRGGKAYLLFTLSGAPREAFEKFGLPRATALFEPTFHGTSVIRSEDIRKDPRYGKNAPHHGMPRGHLPVVSYLAVPVIARSGEVIGGLFFGHNNAGVFTLDSEYVAVGIAAHAAIAIENARLYRTAQEETQSKELLLREFKHRIKNTLSTVQAIAGQSLRSAPQSELEAFSARLQVLARAHDLLTDRDWQQASVHDLTQRTLAPFEKERLLIDGPDATLNANTALLLTMALHELATNAVKYGALSNGEGKVHVAWSIADDRLTLIWREFNGPIVQPPQRKGFGSLLIAQATDNEALIEFAPEGVRCKLPIPLRD